MIIELIKATALLLSLSLLQSFVVRFTRNHQLTKEVVSGAIFGGICVIGMILPIVVTPGVIFDPRTVVLSMAGLFGGPVTSVIAATIAGESFTQCPLTTDHKVVKNLLKEVELISIKILDLKS